MFKLATKIGLYHAREHITAATLEDMLTHIFIHDNYHYSLFSRTKSQLERFQREKAERLVRKKTPWQIQHEARRKEELRRVEADKAEIERRRKYSRIPARYHVVEEGACLPLGCSSIADVIVENDGFTWGQVLKISRFQDDKVKARKPKFKSKTAIQAPASSQSRSAHKNSFWVQTRLHNGPGLDDRKPAKVCLPSRTVDKRIVLASEVPYAVPKKKIVGAEAKLWAISKASPGWLWGKKGAVVGVKMPPC